jgi:hypothetical protein
MSESDDAPDYSRDFVKVPRVALDELIGDELALRVYLLCLGRAAWRAGPRVVRGRIVNVGVGEAMIGRTEIAHKLRASEATIRSAIDRLQKLGYIATKPTSRGTVVTMRGYGEITAPDATKSPAEPPATRQQLTSNSPAAHQQNASKLATNEDQRSGEVETENERTESRSARRREYGRVAHPRRGAVATAALKRAIAVQQELKAEGIDPTAPNIPAVLSPEDYGWKKLLERADEQLAIVSEAEAIAKLEHRIETAAAEARRIGSQEYFVLALMFEPKSFSIGTSRSARQEARDRSGPRSAGGAIGPAEPHRHYRSMLTSHAFSCCVDDSTDVPEEECNCGAFARWKAEQEAQAAS